MPPAPSPSSPRRSRITRAVIAASILLAAGCGGHAAAKSSGPGAQLITVDHWSPPPATGPASTTTFCTLLTALYRHMGELPQAANVKVKEQIVRDYVGFVPSVIAAAPPAVAPAARFYLTDVAATLSKLARVGLDPAKMQGGRTGANLLDPRFAAASRAVLGYSQTYCHYTIGG